MTVSRFHVPAMDCAAEEQLIRMALDDCDERCSNRWASVHATSTTPAT